jgi:hypothetical protein
MCVVKVIRAVDCGRRYFTLVDGRETVPMAVWVTHPFSGRFFHGKNGLGTGGPPIPSVTKVIHSLSGIVHGSSSGTNLLDQLGDLLIDLPALLHLPGDLVHSVDHRGVVAVAEDPGDGRVAVVGEVPTRYMATWRAVTRGRVRLGPQMASMEKP